jgi:signal transduction histidine kinase
MTFRTRLLAAFGVVVLVPLLVFGLGVRREVANRFAAAYEQRVAARVDVMRNDLRREADLITDRLGRLTQALRDDNRFRSALLRGEDRAYVLDYAGRQMRVLGLDFLQIQDDEGRVVSSGQFRNEFDRAGPRVRELSLVRASTEETAFLALVGRNAIAIGGRELILLGGVRTDSAFLAPFARDSEFQVRIAVPGDPGELDPAMGQVWSTALPFIDAEDPGNVQRAELVVTHRTDALAQLQRTVNLWFVVAVLVAMLAALLLAGWLSTRISRPLDAQMRDMERRVAMGDLARQVNHDVKNGLSPLRNVFRHFVQVARDEPEKLPAIFAERQGTVESSITYLEMLAANYARLYPQSDRRPTDVNAVVRAAVGGNGAVKTKLADGLGAVSVDATVLRRVVENLVSNAVDSLDGKVGTVTVATEPGAGTVRIVVGDTGRGMTKPELDRAFDDFYTTKEGGTGLGLSIVRRLVLDSNGTLKVETEPGKGSKFIVELQAPK